ncbi:MAG TPA: hypothetical protein VLS90_11025, partial [Thermodesulfobacteriota bacterium]|nr:hypothetical protein [Thermodesulfobacteriota bacterium]
MMCFIAPLALTAGVFAAYWNSFPGAFQFDDFNVIVGNAAVHSFQAWLSDAPSGIRPALKFTYLLNWVGGAGAFGFHAVNTIIHSLNVVLIYFLSRAFLENRGASPRTAFFCALMFALHPAQTEAVTYISGRSASLMGAFYLGSVLAYHLGSKHEKWFLLRCVSPLLFALALLTKEAAATLPAALLLWDRFRAPRPSIKESFRDSAAHWALLLAGAAAVWAHPGYSRILDGVAAAPGVWDNAAARVNGLYHLVSRMFLIPPLNIDPDFSGEASWNVSLAGKALFLAFLCVSALVCHRKKYFSGFPFLWFFLLLLPTNLVVVRSDLANDRHFYLPSWGMFLAMSMGLEKVAASGPWKRKVAIAWTVFASAAF